MRLGLVPRNTTFYDLFEQAASNAVEAARLAERRFAEFPNGTVSQSDVKALETEGDRLTHATIQLLNTQYVTPFDREDIYALASALDDVVDNIEHACDLLGLYKVDGAAEQSLRQCRVLVGAAEHLERAVAAMRSHRGAEKHLTELKALEDEADRIVRDAIAALFDADDVDPRVIIRWKDIFEALEQAVDACEKAGHVVGNVLVKNA